MINSKKIITFDHTKLKNGMLTTCADADLIP
jgi:hypothetical protein